MKLVISNKCYVDNLFLNSNNKNVSIVNYIFLYNIV